MSVTRTSKTGKALSAQKMGGGVAESGGVSHTARADQRTHRKEKIRTRYMCHVTMVKTQRELPSNTEEGAFIRKRKSASPFQLLCLS